MTQFQQSKSGSWHITVSATRWDHSCYPNREIPVNVATCRYQGNLDRPIILTGEIVTDLPAGATLCRRCATHLHD